MADSSKQGFLNALFQWTVKNTAAEEASSTANNDVKPMNEDQKQWLEEALDNLTVNPIERMKLCISKIKDNETSDQHKKEFLNELCHWAEELDLAKDFFTLGGLEVLVLLLEKKDDEMRAQACSLLAALVQNNEQCQRTIVQSGLQQKLLKIVEESNDADLKTKAVTAISALIRGYTLGQLQLQKFHGAKVLIQALSSPIPRLQTKLCFLINTICSSSAHMKKIFYENGAMAEFIRLFNSDQCPDYQHTLEVILTLSSHKPNSMSLAAESDVALIERFQEKLTERRKSMQNPEGTEDEINIIKQLQALFDAPAASSEVPTPPQNQQLVPSSS